MKILILNGPNINMLGIREPSIYGSETYSALQEKISAYAAGRDVQVEFYQSNHEGSLVDRIQQAYFDGVDGIVFNPGAYTHTSIALLDALKSVMIPCIEVHISRLEQREQFRQTSYIRPACKASVIGHGTEGYMEAIDILLQK